MTSQKAQIDSVLNDCEHLLHLTAQLDRDLTDDEDAAIGKTLDAIRSLDPKFSDGAPTMPESAFQAVAPARAPALHMTDRTYNMGISD